MRGGSRFPESQDVLANFAFSFQGVLERNQETQRPAGSTLQRAGGRGKGMHRGEEPRTGPEKGEFVPVQVRKKKGGVSEE